MSIVLLRTLTRKSIIGFGDFRDLSVQNVLDLHRHNELLNIYYTCRNIDFNQDLKDELCIHGEREINKKDKSDTRYINNFWSYIRECLDEMNAQKTKEEKQRDIHMKFKAKRKKIKDNRNKGFRQATGLYSKGAMKWRNQH